MDWITDQLVPYAYKNNEWVGFDNKESYDIKVGVATWIHAEYETALTSSYPSHCLFPPLQVRYLQDQGFGGAFVWALDLDDFSGKFCGDGPHPLLSYLRKLLNIGKSWNNIGLQRLRRESISLVVCWMLCYFLKCCMVSKKKKSPLDQCWGHFLFHSHSS